MNNLYKKYLKIYLKITALAIEKQKKLISVGQKFGKKTFGNFCS